MASFNVNLMHKGKTWVMRDVTTETTVEEMRSLARTEFGLSETAMIKLLHKGKVLGNNPSRNTKNSDNRSEGGRAHSRCDEGASSSDNVLCATASVPAFPNGVGKNNGKGIKVMVMATETEHIGALNSKRFDPTVRGFDPPNKNNATSLVAASCCWGPDYAQQDPQYKFCRMEECSWQSFGHRATDSAPHAFAARQLLEKLATDPGMRRVITERELVVGTLGEMDPVDDRLKQRAEEHGGLLLGYNTNHGMRIDLKLRQEHDLTFMPYPQLVTTLLHELSHNWVSEHNALFWSNYGQMRVEYLYAHAQLTATGYYANGTTTAQLAGVTEYTTSTTGASTQETTQRILQRISQGVLAELATEMASYGVPLPAVAPAVQQRCRELLEKDNLRKGSKGIGGSSSGNGQKLGTASGSATGVSGSASHNDLRSLALAAAERRAQKNNENVNKEKSRNSHFDGKNGIE